MPSNAARLTPRWYRSLYWRITLGLFAFLALMLAAEAGLFLWTTDRIAGSMPARSPRRLAVLVASDVASALAATPSIDLQQYVTDQFGHVFQPFIIVMRDGRVVANHRDVPEQLREAVPVEVRRLESFARGDRLPSRGLPPERAWEGAGINVNGSVVGAVAVLSGPPPFSRILGEMGPTIGVVAGGVLGVGTVLIALFVFGPARRRLKQVQDATAALGRGNLSVRVPERGGDEVTAVARSFNQMADELARRAQALEASDRARRQLLADVSHELMTPLTAMRGYVETLGMPELELDAETRQRYLRIIDDETHRLEHIVGDLLDLARLEGGGTAIDRSRVSVQALFDRVRSRHERESAARRIRLNLEVVPGAEFVDADPDRLEQALQNLAANALRHTPDGGEIMLSAYPDNGWLKLRVHDNGPGIPPEHLPLIFERFYKVDTARRASGGSGLGLSIVKAIVERHGGTITARNNGGAVFEIALPRHAAEHSTV